MPQERAWRDAGSGVPHADFGFFQISTTIELLHSLNPSRSVLFALSLVVFALAHFDLGRFFFFFFFFFCLNSKSFNLILRNQLRLVLCPKRSLFLVSLYCRIIIYEYSLYLQFLDRRAVSALSHCLQFAQVKISNQKKKKKKKKKKKFC